MVFMTYRCRPIDEVEDIVAADADGLTVDAFDARVRRRSICCVCVDVALLKDVGRVPN